MNATHIAQEVLIGGAGVVLLFLIARLLLNVRAAVKQHRAPKSAAAKVVSHAPEEK